MRFPSLALAKRHLQARSAKYGRPIDFAFGEHGPGHVRQLIRQRHADHVVMGARCQLCQPRTQTRRLLLSKLQNRMCALYEQSSQIAVPAFADAEQFLFASGGVFARH